MDGYSGTPLAKKLGIKENYSIRVINAPANYFQLFPDMPPGVKISGSSKIKKDLIHYFETSLKKLPSNIGALRKELKPAGALWISWYKQSSKMPTDISENSIREIALQLGFVDVKVCAIDELWSGLKLVIPIKDREK